ncbi:MAG: Stk1 family PASTA domain-containing Ser/Thr kinase [Streptosporangiaceae bacterium]
MDTTLSAPIGQLLDGRYLVDSQLARGGMATVYLSRDIRLDRTVAVKIAHPELARDHDFVARFISEARAAARLSSPNVVAVFDQGSTGDLHYIAMEYVPGPTLRELLVARGQLNPREALDIIERVLAGLAVAHDAGIVHRDVKPENVLLGDGRLVKVADFGLARAATGGSNTKTGLLIGTAAYLAPEQVSGTVSDQRSDVYAAGVMLFEMLTGAQPHTGETPLAVAYKHVNSVVPAPSTVNSELPAALDALVALATSRDPDLRPPDARHYLKAITEVRRGQPLPPLPRHGRAAADGNAWPPADQNGHPRQAPAAPQGTAAATGPLPAAPALGRGGGYGGPFPSGGGNGPVGSNPGTSDPADGGANRTMIVSADALEQDFRAGGRSSHGRGGSRRYRDPLLQRWLFSRRILIIIAVVILVILTWWLAAGQYFSMPSVVRLSVRTAKADLSNSGLVPVDAKARHSNVPAGEIIATEPSAGSQVKRGEKVVLIPSLGPVLVTMPPVTGLQLPQAEHALQTIGLSYASPTGETSTSIPAGVVISTSPLAYTRWPQDRAVHLVVSQGPPLPNFVGGPVSAAESAAQSGGFSIQQQQLSTSSLPPGIVTKQEPLPGTPITPGEVVTVYVSPGPAQVSVPDVDGMSLHDAVAALRAAGFQVSVTGFGNRVQGYNPTGQAPQGSTITLSMGFIMP